MKVYHYHPITKEYLGAYKLNEGDKNPFYKSQYLIPANAVKTWPTVKASKNQAVIFNGSGWSLTPDYRGLVYWLETGEKGDISALGETPPNDAIDYDPVALAEEKTAEYEQAQAEAQALAEQQAAEAEATPAEPTP
ncbi:hypothetical protein [Terasakiella sp.]|uniref:hypothetical protein n=1 Tax=Terasakiella sp. TaxID=2034861 RepID=UPI003AA93C3F